jgi:hypothetical protein
MGYLSYYDQTLYPRAVASGQGLVTVDCGIKTCSALGPKLCAGFISKSNWINLLTPHEVNPNSNGEGFISQEVTGAAYIRC